MVQIRSLCKSFAGHTVISGLSVCFEEGITCVMGPSGCGKTTLLRIIAGLETPDSGTIDPDKSKKISLVFQEDRLFDYLSSIRNVMITAPKGCSEDSVIALLHRLGIEDVRKKVSELSGGMRRRVALARALIAEHDILLLDEPCTGLDDDSRVIVLREIHDHAPGHTVICVTHDARDAERLCASTFTMPKAVSAEY